MPCGRVAGSERGVQLPTRVYSLRDAQLDKCSPSKFIDSPTNGLLHIDGQLNVQTGTMSFYCVTRQPELQLISVSTADCTICNLYALHLLATLSSCECVTRLPELLSDALAADCTIHNLYVVTLLSYCYCLSCWPEQQQLISVSTADCSVFEVVCCCGRRHHKSQLAAGRKPWTALHL